MIIEMRSGLKPDFWMVDPWSAFWKVKIATFLHLVTLDHLSESIPSGWILSKETLSVE